MKHKKYSILLILGLIIAMQLFSQESSNGTSKTYEIGFGGGILLPGKFNVSELNEKVKTKLSPGLKVYMDAFINSKLTAGIYVSFANIGIDDADNSVTSLEFGGSLKPRFVLSENIIFKPGLEMGYRRFYTDVAIMDESQGMALNINCEFQYAYTQKLGLFGTVGCVMQPYGGKEHITHLDFGPIFFIMVGVVL